MSQIRPAEPRASAEAGSRLDPSPSPSAYVDLWPDSEDALFAVAVLDDGRFRLEGFSPAAERLTGLNNPDVVGLTPEESMPPASAASVLARFRQCVLEARAISYVETMEFPTGTSDWRTTLQPVCDGSGRVVRLLGRARQIAPLRMTRQALAEEEFHKALDIFPTGIALLDARGVIVFVNSAWERFGARYGGAVGVIGGAYAEVCARSTSAGLPDGPEVAAKLHRLLSEGEPQFGHRYTWGDRHFVLRATRVMLNGELRIVMTHQDVTDLASARELATRSAEHLLMAQDEERARIARELHDSTSQHLVAIGLSLAKLRRANVASEILDDMRHSLAEAYREIRTLTYLLYPPKLSTQGLVATLRVFADGYGRRSGLSVVTTTAGRLDELPLEVQLAVLRVVQEALANGHRHGGARRMAIEVTLKKRGLRLTIVDDGRLAPTGARPEPTGVGIRGMQARFAKFGGSLTVTHRAFGTVVDGFVPAADLVAAGPPRDPAGPRPAPARP